MKVRYICDSCRLVIAEFDHDSLTADGFGLAELGVEEWPQLVQPTTDAVVLITLCDECASFLDGIDPPVLPAFPH